MNVIADRLELVVEGPMAGALNMARDEAALVAVAAGETAGRVRIYGFSPACLSLGRLQSDIGVDWEACRAQGIDVVRRPTGGRAILHEAEVTYAVTCRTDDPDFGGDVLTACARIHGAIAAGLRHLGVLTQAVARHGDERAEARARARIADCFARPASHELVDCGGRKLVGSAQARRGSALLQHGSVLLAPPRAARYFLGESAGEATSEPTPGVSALADGGAGFDELAQALAQGFEESLGARLYAA